MNTLKSLVYDTSYLTRSCSRDEHYFHQKIRKILPKFGNTQMFRIRSKEFCNVTKNHFVRSYGTVSEVSKIYRDKSYFAETLLVSRIVRYMQASCDFT